MLEQKIARRSNGGESVGVPLCFATLDNIGTSRHRSRVSIAVVGFSLFFVGRAGAFADYTINTALYGGPFSNLTISGSGVAVDPAGNVYATAQLSNGTGIWMVNSSGGGGRAVVGYGSNDPCSGQPPATSVRISDLGGVAVDSRGSIYVVQSGGGPVFQVSQGTVASCLTSDSSGRQGFGIVVDNQGNGYFSTGAASYSISNAPLAHAVYRITSSGALPELVAGNGASGCSGGAIGTPDGLALDAAGNLYIADEWCNVIWKVSQPGTAPGIPVVVAGEIFVSRFSGDGGPATNASFIKPTGVAVDAYGNLYIADWLGERIRKVTGGIINTIAGNGVSGYSGDGGPATQAELSSPYSIAVGPGGKIYVGEKGNHRIRLLTPPGAQILRPPPGSVLPPAVTFNWTAVIGATYQVDLSYGLVAPGHGDIASVVTSATALSVNNINCDGRTIYVQLTTQIGATSEPPALYQYTACQTLSLSGSPSALPASGGAVMLTARLENFQPVTLSGLLQITESTSPPAEICQFSFPGYICTILPPVLVATTTIKEPPGSTASNNFSVTVPAMWPTLQYGRTLHFTATLSSPAGGVIASAGIDVIQK